MYTTLETVLFFMVMFLAILLLFVIFKNDKGIIVSKETKLFVKDNITCHIMKIDLEKDIHINDNGNVIIKLKRLV